MSMKIDHFFGDYAITAEVGSRMDVLCRELKVEFPKLRMYHKRDIWYHWVAHFIFMLFTFGMMRRYIQDFTTSPKNTILWSDHHHRNIQKGENLDQVWVCVRHERVHLRHFEKLGTFLMTTIWLIPPFLFCFGRALYIEKPAYLETLRAKYELGGGSWKWAKDPRYKKRWVGQFVGPNYGWMWKIRSQVERWYDEEIARLEKEGIHGST
jgi:hypothetical protein